MKRLLKKFSALALTATLVLLQACQVSNPAQDQKRQDNQQSTPEEVSEQTDAEQPEANSATPSFDYTIVSGDTLTNICQDAFPHDWLKMLPKVAAENNIADPDMIYAGTSITLPYPAILKAPFSPHRHKWIKTLRVARNESSAPVLVSAPAVAVAQSTDRLEAIAKLTDSIELLRKAVEEQSTPAQQALTATVTTDTAPATADAPAIPSSAVTETSATTSEPTQTQTTDAPIAKNGPGWYTITLAPEQAKQQDFEMTSGSFAAVELSNQIARGKWQGRWHHRHDTTAVVTKNVDDSVSIDIELPATPATGTAIAFLQQGKNVLFLQDEIILNQSAPTRGSPTTSTMTTEKENAKQKKLLHGTFKTVPNPFMRTLVVAGPIAARTAVSYVLGGPVLAVLVNVPSVFTFAQHKFQPVAQPQETNNSGSGADKTTTTKP